MVSSSTIGSQSSSRASAFTRLRGRTRWRWHGDFWRLDGKRALVTLVRRAVDLLEDQLADSHSLFEANVQFIAVPDLEANPRTGVLGVVAVTKAGVDRRGRDMHPDRQTGHA